LSIRIGILTVSDKGSRGERQDASSESIRKTLAHLDVQAERYEVVPDEQEVISARFLLQGGPA
jgi:molybdopterin biosynthesis enzyme MoaB